MRFTITFIDSNQNPIIIEAFEITVKSNTVIRCWNETLKNSIDLYLTSDIWYIRDSNDKIIYDVENI